MGLSTQTAKLGGYRSLNETDEHLMHGIEEE